MSRGACMCDVHCTAQAAYSWDSLEFHRAACAIICHWASGGYNIFTSGWAAPYFSPGSVRDVQLSVLQSNPQVQTHFRAFESSVKCLGDSAHVRDVVLARVSMTYVVRALLVYGWLWPKLKCFTPWRGTTYSRCAHPRYASIPIVLCVLVVFAAPSITTLFTQRICGGLHQEIMLVNICRLILYDI